MHEISSRVDSIIASLGASADTDLPHVSQLDRAKQDSHGANLTKDIARLDEIHKELQAIMQRGLSAVAAVRSKINATRSPIHTLPVETLSDIFRLVASAGITKKYLWKFQPNVILRLSLVSRAWRSVVLGCSDFFTSSPDWSRWPLWLCQEWYSRSCDQLVSINLDYRSLTETHYGWSITKKLHAVSELAPRTKSLAIHDGPPGDSTVIRNLIANPHLSSLSQLTLIDFTTPIILPRRICTNLQSLCLLNSSIEPNALESGQQHQFDSLENLHIIFNEDADPSTRWAYIVHASPKISTLRLTSTWKWQDTYRFPNQETSSESLRSVPTLRSIDFEGIHVDDVHCFFGHWELPRLERVSFDGVGSFDGNQWDCGTTFSLLDRAAPNLMSLRVSDEQSSIKATVTSLTERATMLPQLRELILEDTFFDWADRSSRVGNGIEAQLLALVKSRRLNRLTLYFLPSDEGLKELRKHVETVEIIEFAFDPNWIPSSEDPSVEN
ncbi:hypothetical protein DL93DRAFT_2168555 [Clavulina sp. PMI_390]|nr:hypothetical protein DL93DRAFT_2168555 [Clavulina sp. PMI_390]